MSDATRMDRRGLDAWRALAGQDAILAWCRAHDLDPDETCAELEINDGHVHGHTWDRDPEGRFRVGSQTPFTRRLIFPPPPQALHAVPAPEPVADFEEACV